VALMHRAWWRRGRFEFVVKIVYTSKRVTRL